MSTEVDFVGMLRFKHNLSFQISSQRYVTHEGQCSASAFERPLHDWTPPVIISSAAVRHGNSDIFPSNSIKNGLASWTPTVDELPNYLRVYLFYFDNGEE